jgi:acetylornithine/succinyldiaminopimelate/putrescine aminotransferase
LKPFLHASTHGGNNMSIYGTTKLNHSYMLGNNMEGQLKPFLYAFQEIRTRHCLVTPVPGAGHWILARIIIP